MPIAPHARILTLLAAGLAAPAAHAGPCLIWNPRAVAGPTPRGEFGFAYDVTRSRAVLVGGANNLTFTSVFRQAWEWDGLAWSLRATDGPTARCDNALAYDSARHVTVSFGGFNGGFLGDTWEWDGTTWTQRATTGPAPRADSFMVYDQPRAVMVLFGGLAPASMILGDTWEWDGATWTQRTPAASPSPRWIHRMAFDTHRARTVLFGGAAGPTAILGDAWEFDGTTWTQAPTTPAPSPRYGHAMAYDSHRQTTLLFGGQNGSAFGQGVLGDTWEFDGVTWVTDGAPGPSPRSFAKMVYDAGRRKAVLFGGYNGAQFVGDTWEFGQPYANCDDSTTPPTLNVNDFICFQARFAAGDAAANCDDSTAPPTLNVNDFVCFQSRFAAGCA